jgi:hypothetical protein
MMLWKDWRSALVIVRPDAVTGCQRRRFKRYWSKLSQRKRGRATACEFGDSETGQDHGCRQRALGRTAGTRGTPKTRIRSLGTNGFTPDAKKGQETLANVENVSAQSCGPTRGRGFLHSGDDSLTGVVRFCRTATRSRPAFHLSLEKDAPVSRTVHSRESGRIVQIPEVGGLHHRYERHAA